MKLESEVTNIYHLIQVVEIYDVLEHGLTLEDIKRTDRQNWASAQHLCSRKVVTCLRKLKRRKYACFELYVGTKIYLTICGDYVDIFLNTTFSLKRELFYVAKSHSSLDYGECGCFTETTMQVEATSQLT